MDIEKFKLPNGNETYYFEKSNAKEIAFVLCKGVMSFKAVTVVATHPVAIKLVDTLESYTEKPFDKSMIADDDSVCLITFKRSKLPLSGKVNIFYTPLAACFADLEMISGKNMLVYDGIDVGLFNGLVNLNNSIVLFGLDMEEKDNGK